MTHTRPTTAEQIEATRREIERLKNLPPRNYKRRAGSGNPRLSDLIARHERRLKILLDEQAKENTNQ